MQKLITAQTAADILGVSVQRVYELARTRILPPGVTVRVGRQLRFSESELAAWIRGGGAQLPGGWRRDPVD